MSSKPPHLTPLDRRGFLASAAAFSALSPGWARAVQQGGGQTLSGEDIALTIARSHLEIDGRAGHAVTINGTVPGPLIRLREGQRARIAVTNTLDEDTSIHWHGLLVPFQMDGVPGVSFPGIKPGETFVYDFPVIQSGTYWYHSHSGLQEQEGHYAPIIIDPRGADPVAYDREYVIVLSDYTFMHPHLLVQRLKQEPGFFNRQRQTFLGLLGGRDQNAAERRAWGAMRMDPTDILDVNGSVYTYLVNGHGPQDNWTGLFTPGERVRLRFINAGTMTVFNVRIPGLPMSVVQADGQNVRPVEVDEFQIGNAETYDVIVRPGDQAYTLVAEAADRSGMGRGTLAPRAGMTAAVPPLRERPLLTMADMGMGADAHAGHAAPGAADDPHAGHTAAAAAPAAAHSMSMLDHANAPQVRPGPGVQMISPMPEDGTGDPGVGLRDVPHRVLTYRDLAALEPLPQPPVTRELEIHLTGNMERFMWSFDGEKFSEVTRPISFRRNERVRVTLVNDSMMAHPIHLHGHFFEVVNGQGPAQPLKHTVLVQPGRKVAFDLTADAPGDWAFHCHMLLHMHAGMFNVVTVRPMDGVAA